MIALYGRSRYPIRRQTLNSSGWRNRERASSDYLFGQLSRNRPVLRRSHFPQRICRKISARV